MVDTFANSSDDNMIYVLSFKLAKSASYVLNRMSCTFQQQGRIIYNPKTGPKLFKFLIRSHG